MNNTTITISLITTEDKTCLVKISKSDKEVPSLLFSWKKEGIDYSEAWDVIADIEEGKDKKVFDKRSYLDYEFDHSYFQSLGKNLVPEELCAPLWCCRFAIDLFNWLAQITGPYGGIREIKSLQVDCECRVNTHGYLGIKCFLLYGTECDNNDAYAKDRLRFGQFATEIDPLNVKLKRCLSDVNEKRILLGKDLTLNRIALTLLDSDGKFIFASANENDEVAEAALSMEQSLIDRKAESFTSFLIKKKIASPISINYISKSLFILYGGKKHEINDETIESNTSVFGIINSSELLHTSLGLKENILFIRKCAECANKADASLYFFPVNHGASAMPFPAFVLFLVVGDSASQCGQKLESELFPEIRAYFSTALTVEATLLIESARKLSCKSAIGSIMSRNGSHNIGSHVLAALSHNVGTMPDDRVLYQYIQHRMDYIATATTEFPHWRLSAMFVGNVMREFLLQRHLLDYIAGSEGLRAYQYQNHVIAPNQKNAIRVHIRRINDTYSSWEGVAFWMSQDVDSFIAYHDYAENGNALATNKDIAVAIPGGVVGQHAFYTILENVIRNAAKHDWTGLLEEDRINANLEVFVDFRDNRFSGIVECRVWTCVTRKLDDGKCVEIVGGGNHDKVKELKDKIEDKIKLSFIDESGGLRRENWGIAEMRISAGYLKGSDIMEIGGLNNNLSKAGDCATLEIIRPVIIDVDENHSALGFRFDLHKPHELLVVVPTGIEMPDNINLSSNQYGIWFLKEEDLGKSSDLSFAFVLLDQFDLEETYRLKLPFRIIANEVVYRENNERVDLAKRLIRTPQTPIIQFGDMSAFADPDKAEKACKDLLENVYGEWLIHLVDANCNERKGVKLAIDIAGDSGGGGKSLVTKKDLLRFVLENSFNAAIRSFLELYDTEISTSDDWKEFACILKKILITPIRRIASFEMLASKGKRSVRTMSIEDFLRVQIGCWCQEQKLTKKQYSRFCASHLYRKFVQYICGVIIEQANAYLAKYEEEYSTLPEVFRAGDGGQEEITNKDVLIGNVKVNVEFTCNAKKREELYQDGALCYFRHDKRTTDRIGAYREALSGSQGYLASFEVLKERITGREMPIDSKRFLLTLVENALMKILIIDERVKDFANKHSDVNEKLCGLGVAVLSDADEETVTLFKGFHSGEGLSNAKITVKGVNLGDFDILIIHQGVIDKLLADHENKDQVGCFLKMLIRKIRYVLVTTGRGIPANIPEEARVLPYSVIEDAILKCYPEKIILVDAVMNVLPVMNKTPKRRGK